ncbi:hypothetical protein [Ralstonia mannitolilytica]|uniref:hypothetical protein n=1 Tax=Ralstonia mannitolilytica TaxID=105219 RepID=UPI001C943FA9|nr:hypothetical protein [Ralstonia mannitolilytica]MBY4717550.1 hypothetical protein [Ralstonia mannitolilytica]
MAKKEIIEQKNVFGVERINPDKPTIIINSNTHGNLGKTTEEIRFISFYEAVMGFRPVIISADPTDPKVMRERYGQRNSNNILLPERQQQLGVGVVEVDLEEKDGTLADYISQATEMGRDAVIDFKGGNLNAFADTWGGLVPFFNNFSNCHFIWQVPFLEADKDIENLGLQYDLLTSDDIYADIDIVHIFSYGKLGGKNKAEHHMELIAQWDEANQYPSNIKTHKAVFTTAWANVPELINTFRFKDLRAEANKASRDNARMLAENFLKEGDKFWAKTVLSQEQREALAFRPHPVTTQPGRLWGKTLFNREEIQDIADSKQDPLEKDMWLGLLK